MRVDKSREQQATGRVIEITAAFGQSFPHLRDAAALNQHIGCTRPAPRLRVPVLTNQGGAKPRPEEMCIRDRDIPAYLRLAGQGNYLEALRVITARNPLPFITGTICPHHCADKCTRNFYEMCIRDRMNLYSVFGTSSMKPAD